MIKYLKVKNWVILNNYYNFSGSGTMCEDPPKKVTAPKNKFCNFVEINTALFHNKMK